MLILTRHLGETIVIGDNLRVQIGSIKSQVVRLLFDAPDEVSIHREEIYLKIQKEKQDGERNGGARNLSFY